MNLPAKLHHDSREDAKKRKDKKVKNMRWSEGEFTQQPQKSLENMRMCSD